jgi:DNA-binding MarR family transcriptional regulator
MSELARLFDELIRLETELWNGVQARLRADHDLALSWFEPMQVIERTADCRVHDIATALSITVGGTSKLIDRIENAGYCQRRANPNDRRSSIIDLTPPGRRLLTKATDAFEDELTIRLGSVLSSKSLDQFTHALTKLRSSNLAADQIERNP